MTTPDPRHTDTRSDGTEFRYVEGRLDEIVAKGVVSFHLEEMDQSQWWIGLELANGESWMVNLGAVNPRAKGYLFAENDTV